MKKMIYKDFKGARKILKEHLSSNDDIELIINYFINKNETNFDIQEMDVKNIPDHEDNQDYLIRVGTEVFQTRLFKSARPGTGMVFITPRRTYIPKVVNQIWKIVKR
jgi:hypothetical protein